MLGQGQPESKEGLATELGILVAVMCAGLIPHLGSWCHAQDQSRKPSEQFWTLVKPWSKCPGSGMSHTPLGNP